MTAVSAVPAVKEAVDTALRSGIGMLGPPRGVYREGEVPAGAKLPYVIMGTSSETRQGASRYGQPARQQTMQLKSWGADSAEAEDLDAEVVRVLDDVRLPVTGHQVAYCEVERIADLKEQGQTQTTRHCVVSRLRTRTVPT